MGYSQSITFTTRMSRNKYKNIIPCVESYHQGDRVHCVLFFSLQSSLREGGIKDLPPIEKNGGGSLMSTAKYGNYKPEKSNVSNLNPSLSVSF